MIVKAEILWTRKCNLDCQYCNMVQNGKKIKKDLNLWKKGLDNLKKLGCQFIAIYGAEPLMDFEFLPEFISYSKEIGMYHTLITNSSVPKFEQQIKILINSGLNSLTVSFDGKLGNSDKSSLLKSSNAFQAIDFFRHNCPDYRDVAVVFTLTRLNLFEILDWIKILSEKNIFVFFDLIHGNIGNPGTKCKNYPGIEELLFTHEHRGVLIDFFLKVKELKKYPEYKIHQSNSFLNQLIQNPEIYLNRAWNCSKDYSFPAWLTIDTDGTVRVCDDFHIEDSVNDIRFWELDTRYDEAISNLKEKVGKFCKGCFWNTHFDAHRILEGNETFENYINQQKGI